MRTTLALLLASGLALAGCFDTAPPDDLETASTDADAQSASDTATGNTASATAETTATPGGVTIIPFSVQGNTFNGIFACAAIACQGSDLPTSGSGESWFEPDIDGTLQAAELTLTWTASAPLTEELLLGIAYENEKGENDWVYAVGTSPLTLSETALQIPAAKVDAVYVNPYKCQGAPIPATAMLCYAIEQSFTIEGTLTTIAPATTDSATAQP